MFQTAVVEKFKTRILCSVTFFLTKMVPFMRQTGKYCAARQVANDSTVRRMHFACWIIKATDTHLECVLLIAFPRQHWLR